MKRLTVFLLTLAMVLGMCACTDSGSTAQTQDSTAAANTDGLQIGYSKVNITPDFSLGLAGYSNKETRRSEGFVDYIYATCIAATEGDETVLFYTVDNCQASENAVKKVRAAVSPATGIPENQIFVGATHSHSCPALTVADDEGKQYYELFLNACVQAANEALADRSAATVLAATPEFEGMTFVRHYEMADGTYAGSNFGSFSGQIVGHATQADSRMVLVKFDRAEDKKDVLLVNWQGHPDSASAIGMNLISASYPGPLRDELEKLSGMHVAFFTGADGNQNTSSKIESEAHNLNWQEYGIKMGQLANEALSQLKPIEGTGVKSTTMMFDAEIDHSWDHMLKEANEVFDLWKSAGISAGNALGKQYGFTSSYQARAIRTRADMARTKQLSVSAFRIGGVGFTTGSYEMFSDQGIYVRENSPFEVTFLITGNDTYIPSREAYVYRSYEADTGYYAPGTAEALAENYVKMLETVKE